MSGVLSAIRISTGVITGYCSDN